MKRMMQDVVISPGGTGVKAILEGYSSAGKTGTAQKVDPATRLYSHTKYVGSFAGFAPVNNPAIVVAVILDSAVGLHQGGQVAAPVFQRVAQQVLEYLHVPHDVELSPGRQLLLARRQVREEDLAESSPDHLGSPLDLSDGTVDAIAPSLAQAEAMRAPAWARREGVQREKGVINASLEQRDTEQQKTEQPATEQPAAEQQRGAQPPDILQLAAKRPDREGRASEPQPAAQDVPGEASPSGAETSADLAPYGNGTVVLEVEPGGVLVPSFAGKSVRKAIEMAVESGLELDAVGSGIAEDQSPRAGAHVTAGAKITVKFGR
jgi:cell division protein FtsI (penicillin-binding protein 3)